MHFSVRMSVSTYIQPEILCAQLLLHSLMDFVHTHTQWPTLHGDDRKDGILWCRKFYMSYWGHPCPTDTLLVLLNWCIFVHEYHRLIKKKVISYDHIYFANWNQETCYCAHQLMTLFNCRERPLYLHVQAGTQDAVNCKWDIKQCPNITYQTEDG